MADRRVTIDHGGALAATPLGRCVADGLAEIASAFRVPETRNGHVYFRRLEFPGARRLWPEGRGPCEGK